MINRIIIAHRYCLGSAATNRIIAYCKGFLQEVREVYLVLGNETDESLPIIEGVQVVEAVAEHHRSITHRMAAAVKSFYRPKDSVILIYGTPTLCWYLPKSKYNIFYECTEVPFYGRKKTVLLWIKEIIKIILAKRATGMMVISGALKGYFEEKGIRKVAVVNMFVDSERFHNSSQIKQDDLYIGYCGTISPFKDGVDVLLKAFAFFHKSHQDYRLKIIGGFESKHAEDYLKRLVDDLHIIDYVDFVGKVRPEQMPDLLCGAQMLALARPKNDQSKYGFPTKLGEYLATGKPIVATKVGEIGFFLHDGINCRLVEPDNPEAFANAMSWVADHYVDALRLGERGKELTIREFSSIEQSKHALAFMETCIKDSYNRQF